MKKPIGVVAVAFAWGGILVILSTMFGMPELPNASIEEENLFLLKDIRWCLFGIVLILCGIFVSTLKKDA